MQTRCLFDLYNNCTDTYTNFKGSDSSFKPKKIIAEKKIFLSVRTIEDGVLYHWIHFYGSPIEARNYSYTLEYINDAKTPKVTCSFSDQVVSIDETVDSVIENGNCFAISRKVLANKFIQECGRFKFSVKIRNLKEEVKDDNVESGVSDVDE